MRDMALSASIENIADSTPTPGQELAALGLAPMEGVTVLPMRLWMHLASAPKSLATPFLRVTATYPSQELPRTFAPELTELRDAVPYQLVPQIMAADQADFVRIAPLFLRHTPFVELNCGCPSPTCVGSGAGSSLLRDADEFRSVIHGITSELGAERFAVKMRTGFKDDEEFTTLLSALSEHNLARLTVHGRTRPDRYKGYARWDLIELAANMAQAPVIASGDVVDIGSLAHRSKIAPSVKGTIIGRGALRNPWIFAELRTGAPVNLKFSTLKLALITHALLHELANTDMEGLFELAKTGLFLRECGTDEDRWLHVHDQLSHRLWPSATGSITLHEPREVSRVTLGRLKMLWNYLRSSLPPPFFEPGPLRAGNLAGFLAGLSSAYEASGRPVDLYLRHAPEWDWLYSGGKQQAETCPT